MFSQNISTVRLSPFALPALVLLGGLPVAMVFSRATMEVCGGGICLLLLANSVLHKNWQWLKQAPVLVMLGLWVYSLPLSLHYAQWGRFILLFAAVVYWLSEYKQEMRKVALVWLFVLVVVAVDALFQFATGASLLGNPTLYAGAPLPVARLTGPFEKPVVGIFLAKMSVGVFAFAFFYAWRRHDVRQLYFTLALLLIVSFAILLSNERTATISFFLALAVAYMALFIKFRELRVVLAGLACVQLAALAAAIIFSTPLQNALSNSHQSWQDFSNSPYGQLWQASILMWREHVLAGVGIHEFRNACLGLLEKGAIGYCNLHPHNFYLEWLSELGIIGFWGAVLWIASMVVMISTARFQHKKERYALRLAGVMVLIVNFFPFVATQSAFSNWPAMLMWLSVAMPLALIRSESRP